MICGGAFEPPFHVGISTPDVAGLMATLGPLLGLTWVDLPRTPVMYHAPHFPHASVRPASRVVCSAEGPLHVELLAAEDGTVYPPERGTHLHHVGYWVDDFPGTLATFRAEGWRVEVTIADVEQQPSVFAYLSHPGRIWIELVDIANRAWLEELLRSGG